MHKTKVGISEHIRFKEYSKKLPTKLFKELKSLTQNAQLKLKADSNRQITGIVIQMLLLI